MKLPEYPRLKSSGIEWLGLIPAHWLVDRLKRSVDGCRNGIWGDDAEGGVNDVVCIRVADFDRVTFKVIENPQTLRAIPRHERATRELKHNDLLIEKSGGGEKQLVGCVESFDHSFEAVSSNFVARMRPLSGMHSRYWTYAHASLYAGRINYPSIKHTTGIQNLDAGAYLNERFVFPPFEEQRAIADFLDRETARLDRLVGKKRELIEKLKEKRTALFSRTVTKGLPAEAAAKAGLKPHPKLKPSGIEWLGDIPEHWQVKPFRHLMKDGTRSGLYKSSDYVDPDGTPIIQMGEAFASPLVESTAADRLRLTAREKETWGLERDDLLFARRSLVFEGSGKCSMVGELPERHVFESSLIRVRPRRGHTNPNFLFWFIRGAFSRAQILAITKQVTISGLDTQQLKKIAILSPPLPEQEVIADYLARETAKIDKLMEKVEAAIERLQEYRTALITAAVTGKIDVRKK